MRTRLLIALPEFDHQDAPLAALHGRDAVVLVALEHERVARRAEAVLHQVPVGLERREVAAAELVRVDEQGLGDKLGFQVADALRMPFADNSFDLVWSLESGEHMPDKRQFVSELTRVVKPGGRVIIVTWCHRDLEAGEEGLRPREERLLRTINRAFYLPRWCSVADYVGLARDFGLKGDRKSVV